MRRISIGESGGLSAFARKLREELLGVSFKGLERSIATHFEFLLSNPYDFNPPQNVLHTGENTSALYWKGNLGIYILHEPRNCGIRVVIRNLLCGASLDLLWEISHEAPLPQADIEDFLERFDRTGLNSLLDERRRGASSGDVLARMSRLLKNLLDGDLSPMMRGDLGLLNDLALKEIVARRPRDIG